MIPSKTDILVGLLQHNYLPLNAQKRDNVPPIFSTKLLTVTVAKKIYALKGRKDGYDQVLYRLTRFNNVPRLLSLPHPKPYIDLAVCVSENWDKLKYVCRNSASIVRPARHKDGRVLIMDYDKSWQTHARNLSQAFNCAFTVHADITNCFSSVYSHAVPWALVGFVEAKHKKEYRYKSEWFNKIDEYQRMMQRNETHGIPVGPAISNVIVELILARVDEIMQKDFKFHRFIDDYVCYCKTHQQAQEFIHRLSVELFRYKFNLNIKKVSIRPLPDLNDKAWISDLSNRLPKGKEISSYEARTYIDYAVSIHKNEPDGSVLKYAVNAIKGRLKEEAIRGIAEYIIFLAYYYPILLPSLASLFQALPKAQVRKYAEHLRQILKANALYHRSDGMCWSLYYLLKYRCDIADDFADSILKTEDCLSLLLLYLFKSHKEKVVAYVKGIDKDDLYHLDQYWPLTYQLFFDGEIADPYGSDGCFKVLKKSGFSILNERL